MVADSDYSDRGLQSIVSEKESGDNKNVFLIIPICHLLYLI